MPELPEVESVRRGLAKVLVGNKINRIVYHRQDLRYPLPAVPPEVIGKQITEVGRRAKYILIHTDADYTLLSHLGMTGGWFHHKDAIPSRQDHNHIELHLSPDKIMYYNDPRRFGVFDILPTSALDGSKYFAHIGPDPFRKDGFHESYIEGALRNKRSPIKSALLDQRVVAGLGNIYVSEILFAAHIHPLSLSSKVATCSSLPSMVDHTERIMNQAIKHGGSTIDTFLDIDASVGNMAPNLQVYGRKGEQCYVCGHKIKMVRLSGRSTFFCTRCQPPLSAAQ